MKGIGALGVVVGDHDAGGSGLGIPAFELAQIAPGGVFKDLEPILDGGGLTVVAGEIEIGCAAVIGVAHQALEHADHLGALFIDRGGVEIVDLDIGVGAHRVGQRPGILAKLAGAQQGDILDPLDGGAAPVAGKALVAEHRQPFLEAKLEPVAAGDAVAGPVVKVFMRDHRLDAGVIVVGGGFRAGQNEAGVEDVETLVLHRAHVEIADRDDVEKIEIVFAPVGGFVPGHGVFQGCHGVAAAAFVAGADPDVERHLAARAGGKAVRPGAQIACHQREQVGGLGPGVVPFGKARTGGGGVAV